MGTVVFSRFQTAIRNARSRLMASPAALAATLERTRGSLGVCVDTYTFSLCCAFADHFNRF